MRISPGRRRIILLLTVLPALVLLICTGFYMLWQVRGLMKHLDVLLVDEVRRQTGREVRVQRVDASRLGTATVYGLRIANGKSFDSGTLLEAKRVQVRYSWAPLLFRHTPPIQIVDSIKIGSPTILIERYKNGKLNVQDLMVRKPGPPRPPFIGIIRLDRGKVEFRDYKAHQKGSTPTVLRFADLSGVFDAADVPQYVYSFSGRGVDGKLVDKMSLSGSLNGKKGILSLDVKGNNAAIAFWTSYFIRPTSVDIQDGRADVSMSATRQITKGHHQVWSFAGMADVRNATVGVIGLKNAAKNVRGRFELTNSSLSFDVKANANGIPVTVNGAVAGFRDPKLDIHVTSKRADFSRALQVVQAPAFTKKVRLSRVGPFSLDIVGPTKKLVIGVRATGPSLVWNGYRAEDIKVKATYVKNAVEIEKASANALGGRAELTGRVLLAGANTQLQLSGKAAHIDMGAAPQMKRLNIRGIASGSFTVTGPAANPEVRADVQVPRGTFNKVVLKDASARVAVRSGTVLIQQLSTAAAGGVIRLSGDVNASKLDLMCSADGVDLGTLHKQLGLEGAYGGRGSFNGTIQGSPTNPKVSGDAEVYNARFNDYIFDYAEGHIAATASSVVFDHVVVRVIPGEVTLQGKVSGINTPVPSVDLDAKVEDLRLDRVLALLNTKADASGAVSGQLSIHGSGGNIKASGGVKLSDGTLAGYPVDSAEAAFSYADGSISLTGLQAHSKDSVFTGEGSTDKSGSLQFAFKADNVNLAPISQKTKPYLMMSGTASMNGNLTGTLSSPNLQASVSSNGPVINTVRFDKFNAGVVWDGTKLVVSDIGLSSPSGSLAIKSASYDAGSNAVIVDGGSIKDFSIPTIYALVSENRPQPSEHTSSVGFNIGLGSPDKGLINATFSASGPLDDLAADVRAKASGIDFGEIKNVNLDVTAKSRKGQITIDSLSATADALSVTAQGTLASDGNMNLDVDAYNVDLAALTAGTGLSTLKGTATARASIRGNLGSPLITASLEMAEPVIHGIKFDGLRASQITINSDTIDVSRVQLTGQDMSSVAYGKIPWSWSTFSVPQDRQLDLHAKLDGQALRLIPQFTNVIVPDQSHPGQVAASLDITGTSSNPNVTGQITLADANIGVKGLNTEFTGINGKMSVGRDSIQIDSFTGASNNGGKFDFRGSVPWSWSTFSVPENLPLDLHAKLIDQSLSVIAAFTDSIIPDPMHPGRASLDLDVTGGFNNPDVRGRVTIADGDIGIKGLKTEFQNIQAKVSFDQKRIQFDSFSAVSSDGGRVDVVQSSNGRPGMLYVRKTDAESPGAYAPIVVKLSGLNLSEENMFGYQERIKGGMTSPDNGLEISGWILEPLIKGKIDVSQAAALISAVSKRPPAKQWKFAIDPKFDLTFNLDKDVWFHNPMLMALMQGQGHLGGNLSAPKVDASLKIAQGTIRLPTARMRITSGAVTANWTPSDDRAHVIVDVRAQTSLAASSPASATGGQKRYTIVMTVHGPLDNLQSENIDLRSEPPGLSRSQILTALGKFDEIFPGGELALNNRLKDIFNVAVSPLLFDPLESRFIDALGLEEFDIEYGLDQPLSVYLSKKVFGDIYMSYWRMMTGAPSITGVNYTMSLNYRLRDWLNLSYVIDSRRMGIIEASYNIRF